jgi:hypothetical protein
MDTFQGYDNVIGFMIGNEVVAKETDSPAAPYVKAATRDMKAYRDSKGYRKIPIGYSAADILELRPMLQDYLTCGGNSSDNIEFFGLNSYSWCGDSNYNLSTYNQVEEEGHDFPVPIFFSETGCIVPPHRTWGDQDAIFGPEMVNDFSGAIAYEWINEENLYGLISYGGDPAAGDVVRSGVPTPVVPDFDNLKSKWATLTPTGVSLAAYKPTDISTRACPSSTPGGWWQVNGNVQLPTLGQSMGADATYTTMPSATSDPTDDSGVTADNATSTSTSSAAASGDAGDKGDDDSAASFDKQVTVMGASLAAIILGVCLML